MALLPVYTLTVFEENDETVLFEVSTDPAHQAPFLKAFTNFPEQEVDFVNGSASIGQMNVQIVDVPDDPTDQDTGFLTGLLSDPSGASQLMGHRVLAQQDVGTGPETVLDGVIRSVTLLDTFSSFELELRDIRERERKTRAFERTDTPTVLPRGVLHGYGIDVRILFGTFVYPVPATPPLTGEYVERSSVQGEINIFPQSPAEAYELVITGPMKDALENVSPLEDEREVFLFDRWKLLWRDKAAGGLYSEVTRVAQRHSGLIGGGYSQLYYEDSRAPGQTINILQINNVISGDALPSNGQLIEFIVQYDGPVTDDWPLHLQGLTVGELLRNTYRGDYSDEPPRIRYDEAALLTLTTPVRGKIKKPVPDLRAWAEKHAYPLSHSAPTLNAAGEISPVTYLLPDASQTLPTLSDSNCRPSGGGWKHGTEDAINFVRVIYQREYAIPAVKGSKTAAPIAMSDRIRSREVWEEHHIEESIDLLGERELTIESDLLTAIGGAKSGPLFGDVTDETGARVAERIARMVTDRFAVGGQYFSLHGARTDADVEALRVGDWVTVGPSWMPGHAAQ